MSFHHSPNPQDPDGNIYSTAVVVRAGNDRMQSDMINIMMSRNENISREQAIVLLEMYASNFERILKHQYTKMASIPEWKAFNNKNINTPGEDPAVNQPEEHETPVLTDCLNVLSNSRTVMWGSVVQLYGQHLEFDRTDVKQGLFLIEPANQLVIKVSTLVRVKPENVIFMIPGSIPAAGYSIELRTRCPHTGALRSATLPDLINVVI